MKISFQGIDESVVTFAAGTGITVGRLCKLSESRTVSGCSNGDAFCGLAVSEQGGCAGVQIGGYVTLNYSGTTPSAGWQKLSSDADGCVKTNTGGREYLVVDVDETAGTVGLFL